MGIFETRSSLRCGTIKTPAQWYSKELSLSTPLNALFIQAAKTFFANFFGRNQTIAQLEVVHYNNLKSNASPLSLLVRESQPRKSSRDVCRRDFWLIVPLEKT
jgi:hypothetical protein